MGSLIEDFHKTVKDTYDISLEECKLICDTPFKFVKEVLNRGVMKNIRLQYFGVFQVSSSRVKYSKKNLQEKYDKGKMSKEDFEERLKILNKHES